MWVIDLTQALGTQGVLKAGESTHAQTVTVTVPSGQRVVLGHHVYALPYPNTPPVIESEPDELALAYLPYTYQVDAHDPDGTLLGYVLMSRPQGMTISDQGLIEWSPTELSPSSADVVLRVYDRRGGYAQQAFTLSVLGGNTAPVVADIESNYVIAEGQPFMLALQAQDAESQLLSYFADNLPPGAIFDPVEHAFKWIPGYDQSGFYRGILLSVTDGIETVTKSFDLEVLPANAPPLMKPVPDRTVREGDPIRIDLKAFDFDGDLLTFDSEMLPGGAFLDPNTSVFEWTPSFVQAGTFVVPFSVSDGLTTTRISTTLTVLNANGAPVFDELGAFSVLENQPFGFVAFARDPDNPLYELPVRDPDGNLVFLGDELPKTVSYTISGLPEGATFDLETAQLRWKPTYDQAGTYIIHITATDTGDGRRCRQEHLDRRAGLRR